MNYETAYKEALEKAMTINSGKYVDIPAEDTVLEYIFPELKESEDEKIRKALIELVKYAKRNCFELLHKPFNIVSMDAMLAWLEKQGDKDKLIKELGEYKVKYTQEVLESYLNSMNNKDDERLRKTTIAFLKDFAEQGYENAVECIDWLEKQGQKPQGKSALEAINEAKVDNQNCVKPVDFKAEHFYVSKVDGQIHDMTYNPADKAEPSKFYPGEWVVRGNVIAQILDVQEQYYVGLDTEGHDFTASRFLSDDKIHLWTIEDAKDGDVLVTANGRPFIYKGCFDSDHPNAPVAYCGIDTEGYLCRGRYNHWWTDEKVQPATKEQRDLLFQKINEEGYEWDAEKKELKKITDNTYCSENCKSYQETGTCFLNIEHGKYYYCIKDYYAGGNKRASKGDVVQAKRGMSMMGLGAKANEYFLPVYQMPHQEWSEEDERNMQNIDSVLFYDKNLPEDTCMRLRNWLQSIKQRLGWKPSKEQMKALHDLNLTGKISYAGQGQVLIELYNDLKKLKGE